MYRSSELNIEVQLRQKSVKSGYQPKEYRRTYLIITNNLDIVRTVYHLVIYMQSNKIHKVILMSEFIQHLC